MSSKRQSQKKLMLLIHGVQTGKVNKERVPSNVRKMARKMSSKSVMEFIKTPQEKLPNKIKEEITLVLKEIRDSMTLNEEQTNVISNEFTVTQNYDDYIKKFKGNDFTQKEVDSVNNYADIKPSTLEKNILKYESSDQFGNNIKSTILKLSENGQFLYICFTKYSQTNKPQTEPVNTTEVTEKIFITRSTPFKDEIKGSEILSNFLRRLDI